MKGCTPLGATSWLGFLALPLVALGCGGESTTHVGGDEITVRDSSGVTVIVVPEPALDALPVWRLAERPRVSIGETEGEEPYLFTRIFQAVRLPDGRYALAEGGTVEVRLFDAEGRFVRRIGRGGDGPAEFGALPMIRAGNDGTLVTFDARRWRTLTFDTTGALMDSQPWSPEGCMQESMGVATPCFFRGYLADGRPILVRQQHPAADRALVGARFDTLRLTVVLRGPDGLVPLDSRTLPPIEVYQFADQSGAERVVAAGPMLAPIPTVVAGQGHVAVAIQDRFTFHVYDERGTLVRLIRVHRARTPVEEETQRALLASDPPLTPLPEAGVADSLPAFDRAWMGDNDELWVKDFAMDPLGDQAVDEPTRYTIFGADGVPVARLEVRPDPVFDGQSVRTDLGGNLDEYRVVTEDALGVQRLLVFDIVKTPPS